MKQEIKYFFSLVQRRSISALGNVQDFIKFFGRSGSIFVLIKQVRIETDEISFKRQLFAERLRRSRNPSGF
jgi:hypothetical protein